MLRRIKGVTLRDKVKSGHQKELGVNNIQEKVRKIRLLWYGHMQRMEENNKVTIVDGWIVSEGTCRNCGSPRRMPRTAHSGNQECWPLF